MIGPDTNEPTEIDSTGLTVPVEFTTAMIGPRETSAWRNLGCEYFCRCDRMVKKMPAPTPSNTTRMMVVLMGNFIANPELPLIQSAEITLYYATTLAIIAFQKWSGKPNLNRS